MPSCCGRYWIVTVLFGATPLSAFAATSLWVVVGVSADNIFVFHETWRQASRLLLLLRYRVVAVATWQASRLLLLL